MASTPGGSSRVPPTSNQAQYYCHECHWEGAPLRVPDPQCPNCNSDFVEEIENTGQDDPREFDQEQELIFPPGVFAGLGNAGAGNPLPFAFGPNGIHMGLPAENDNAHRGGAGGAGAAGGGANVNGQVFVRVIGGNLPGQAGAGAGGAGGAAGEEQADQFVRGLMQVFGLVPPVAHPGRAEDAPGDPHDADLGPGAYAYQQRGNNEQPIRNLATFLGEAFGARQAHPADAPDNNPFAEGGHEAAPPAQERAGQAPQGFGQPMNYLYSLLQAFGGAGARVAFGGGVGGAANVGDFAWGDQGFQQILNDLMEQAAGRQGPQPATPEIIKALPRLKVTQDVLNLASMTDCAICKDEFEIDNELITLPCRHAFHDECIKPWLESSGTCPVCRYHLVPQPGDEDYNADGTPLSPNQAGSSTSASPAPRQPHRSSSTSSNLLSPSTARIPDVEGSTLPGSFPFPQSSFGGRRDADDDPEEMDLGGGAPVASGSGLRGGHGARNDGDDLVMEDVD